MSFSFWVSVENHLPLPLSLSVSVETFR